jgi:hypothetical protein
MDENTKAVDAEVSTEAGRCSDRERSDDVAERREDDTMASAVGDLAAHLRALDGAHAMLELARGELAGALTGLAELLERLPDDVRGGARAIAAAAVRRHAAREPDRDPIPALVARLPGTELPQPAPAPATPARAARPRPPSVAERSDDAAERSDDATSVATATWPAEAAPERRPGKGRPSRGSMSLVRAMSLLRSRGYKVSAPNRAGGPYRVGDLRLSGETLVGLAERVEAGLDPSLPGAPQPTLPRRYNDERPRP